MPGVPHEMQEMVERAVLPDLRRADGRGGRHRQPDAADVGRERERAQRAARRRHRTSSTSAGDPTLAFLASGWEGLKVRLTAGRADAAAAASVLDRAGRPRLRAMLGSIVFGVDDETMESVVLDLLREPGSDPRPGRVGHRRTGRGPPHGRPGRQRRAARLDRVVRQRREVRPARRARRDRWSREAGAARWPIGARRVLGADVGLALTGVAGPAEQDGLPVGTLCVGVTSADGTATATLRLGAPAGADAPVRRDHRARPAPSPTAARRPRPEPPA